MTRQNYIVSKLLDRSIIVKENFKVHRAVYEMLSKEEIGVLTQVKKASATKNITYAIHGGKLLR